MCFGVAVPFIVGHAHMTDGYPGSNIAVSPTDEFLSTPVTQAMIEQPSDSES